MNVLRANKIDDVDNWWDDDYYTYILVKDAGSLPGLNKKIGHIMDKYNAAENKAMGMADCTFYSRFAAFICIPIFAMR